MVASLCGVALFGPSANADPPAKADPPGWVTVQYGVPGRGMTSKLLKQATLSVCTNGEFGDPAPNLKKACYLANGTKVAEENTKFVTPGPVCRRIPVKYVAVNGASKERSFCEGRSGKCSNEVFGVDPAVGVKKHCEVEGKRVAEEGGYWQTPKTEDCLCDGKPLIDFEYNVTNVNQD